MRTLNTLNGRLMEVRLAGDPQCYSYRPMAVGETEVLELLTLITFEQLTLDVIRYIKIYFAQHSPQSTLAVH